MDIVLNKIKGILRSYTEQDSILRLRVCLCNQATTAQMLDVLLLEDSASLKPLLHQTITLGFKENHVVLGLKLEGLHNVFDAEILQIEVDTLFARLTLKTFLQAEDFQPITALCPLGFIAQNALKNRDCIQWHIPENSIMLYAEF